MGKTKFLNIFMALVIAFSAMAAPVSANAAQAAVPEGAEVLLETETFDYADREEMKAAGWTLDWAATQDASGLVDGAFKIGYVSGGSDGGRIYKNLPRRAVGIWTAEFDITPDSSAVSSAYITANARFLLFGTDNSIKVDTDNAMEMRYENGQTYHCTASYDLNSDIMEVTVENIETGEKETIKDTSPKEKLDYIGTMQFQTWGCSNPESAVMIDNVTIYVTTEEFEFFSDDFGYADKAEMKAAGWTIDWEADTDASYLKDGAFYLGITTGGGNAARIYRSYPAQKSGNWTAEFDIIPDSNIETVVKATNAAELLIFNRNNGITVNATEKTMEMKYVDGRTYRCKVSYDLDSDVMAAIVTDTVTGESEGVKLTKTNNPPAEINNIIFQMWNTQDMATQPPAVTGIDNLRVYMTHEDTELPEPSTPPGPTETPEPGEIEVLLPTDAFDYADKAEMKEAGWTLYWAADENASGLEGGAFKIGYATDGQNGGRIEKTLDRQSTGIWTAEFDIAPDSSATSSAYITENARFLLFGTDNSIKVDTDNAMEMRYVDGQMYHCTAAYDLDNDIMEVTVENTTTGEKETIRDTSPKAILNEIGVMQFQTWGHNDPARGVMIDNVTVYMGKKDQEEPEPTPSPDPERVDVLYENNFDDAGSVTDFSEEAGWTHGSFNGKHGGLQDDGTVALIDEDGNKYLYLAHTQESVQADESVSIAYEFPAVTSGQIVYDYDIMVDGTNRTFLQYGYYAYMDYSIDRQGNIYNDYWRPGNRKTLATETVKPLKWYHVTLTADATSAMSTLYITDKETGAAVVDVDIAGMGNKNIGRFAIDIVDNPRTNAIGGAYIDNLRITRTYKAAATPRPLPEEKFKFSEDFNSYNDIDGMLSNGWSIQTDETNTEESKIVGDGADKAFYLGLDAQTDNIQAKKGYDTVIAEGKAKLTFDIIPGDNVLTYVWMDGTGEGAGSSWNANRISLIVFTGGQIGIGGAGSGVSMAVCSYTPGVQYNCSIVIDLENDTFTADIRNEAGALLGSATLDYKEHAGTDIKSLTGLTLQQWAASANTGSTFDNIVVEKLPEDAPVISASQMTFVTNGDSSYNYKAVSTLTDRIRINCGAVMDADTLKGIQLTSSAGEAAVYTISAEGNYINIDLGKTLAPNETYSIVIPAEAANIDGVTIGAQQTLVFTTKDDAAYTAAVQKITVDGQDVTGISQIRTGSEVTAEIKLDNAAGEAKKAVAIFSVYGADGVFMETAYQVIDVGAGEKLEQPVVFTAGDMTGATAVKVMLWDGFETIKPLCDGKTFE